MAEPIRYAVDLSDRVHHLVRVRMRVPADVAAGARLVLPTWTPGSYVVRNYARHVQWIRAVDTNGGALAIEMDGTTAWRLPSHVDGEATVTLELYGNDLSVRTNHVDDHHALLIPAATFPYVEGASDRPHEVTIDPDDPSHSVWAMLPSGPTPGTFMADDRDHLIDSAFEVGDLPSLRFEVEGVPHEFVWAGHGPTPDLATIAEEATAIAGVARQIFGGSLPIDRYLILCVGWDRGGGGLEHRDGTVLQMPVRAFTDDDLRARFQSLLAHEYLHLWNVKRLVPAALVTPDYERPTHTPSLWIAEGWTAYYDELLPTRAGIWQPRQLLDHLADNARRVLDTPGTHLQALRQASHEAWTKHYIRDENTANVATDYYGHGAAVAWELDLRIRSTTPDSRGLDDVLQLLWYRHARAPEGYDEQDALDAIAEVADREVAELAERRVAQPGQPVIDDDLLATVGLRWRAEAGTEPSLGVEVTEDDQGAVFSTVLRDRAAWRAGITGGDRLVAVDGTTVGRGELVRTLRACVVGEAARFTVLRGPRLLTLDVVPDAPRPRWLLEPDPGAPAAAIEQFARWCGQPHATLV